MDQEQSDNLNKLSRLVRYWILKSSTAAGSGHPTSSLSATELMTGLMYSGIFKYNLNKPDYHNNDRLVFSKGHASPLFYSLWAASGKFTEKALLTFRKFNSRFEGHPTMSFPYTEAATGSLGQGLSIGVGMAINAKYLDKLPYRTYILLGDGEMAEGSQWEALQLATHYKLDNLVGILDVNRLGQTGETMYGHDLKAYHKRVAAFGWEVITLNDGHSLPAIINAYEKALKIKGKPVMIIAKTLKGKGVPYFENKNGWHGKTLNKEELKKALAEFGPVDKKIRGVIESPKSLKLKKIKVKKTGKPLIFKEPAATRKAYGLALNRLFSKYRNIVALDAEVSNSTYAQTFAKRHPNNFFEMFIAEQNMVGAALGLSRRGKIPFVSTFAAFFTRAFDQIRMSQYSEANIKFIGSHAGVSVGEDGPSQMGLEDIAMFRSILPSVVLYPADAVSADNLLEQAAKHKGLVYLRTTRTDTPIIYKPGTRFSIGSSKVLRSSKEDVLTVVSAGITLHEALAAAEQLARKNIAVRVIDLYSIKPLDVKTLKQAARETKAIITVEDHYPAGGIGEAVAQALAGSKTTIISLAVKKRPRSGTAAQLLDYAGISKKAILKEVSKLI
ncbi:MAG: transketolase [Patescibacteria group bacterium]